MEPELLQQLTALREQVALLTISQESLDAARDRWEPLVQPKVTEREEYLEVVRDGGATTGLVAPRWLCHLLGLPHRVAHIILTTRSGLVLLQRRAATKTDHPDAWDLSAGGHVPYAEPSSSFEVGAMRELTEELFSGTNPESVRSLLAGELIPVGPPVLQRDEEPLRSPPYYNSEWCQLYTCTLTGEAWERFFPDPAEVAGLYLCSLESASSLLPDAAPGLRFSLPRFIDWSRAL